MDGIVLSHVAGQSGQRRPRRVSVALNFRHHLIELHLFQVRMADAEVILCPKLVTYIPLRSCQQKASRSLIRTNNTRSPMGRLQVIAFKVLPLLLFTCSALGYTVQAPMPEVEKVAEQFIEAIKSGDTKRIREHLAEAKAGEPKAGQDKWIALMATTGPKLPEERFRPLSLSVGSGDFALVRGGFGPDGYMRFIKVGAQWKVMGPGDVVAQYGVTQEQASAFQKFSKPYTQGWARDEANAAKAANKAADKVAAKAALPKPVAGKGFFFSAATQAYLDQVLPQETFSQANPIGFLLAMANDVESVRSLVPLAQPGDDMKLAGLVAGRSKTPTLAEAKRIRGPAKASFDDDALAGVVAGLAMSGRYDDAVKLANTVRYANIRPRSIALEIAPTKERVEAFRRDFPSDKQYGGDELRRLMRAAVASGADGALVEELLRIARSNFPTNPDIQNELRLTAASAYFRAGNVAAAQKVAEGIGQALVKSRLAPIRVREAARAGDIATVEAALKLASGEERTYITNMLAYAQARGGSADAALTDCRALGTRKDSDGWAPVRFGLIAAGLKAAGNEDGARKAIEEGVAHVKSRPVESRSKFAGKLLVATLIGLDWHTYNGAFTDVW